MTRGRLASVACALAVTLAALSPVRADTMEKIKTTGAITIGYREASPPFSFNGEAGRPAGYSVDLCNRIAAAAKAELGLSELAVHYVPVTPETRIDRLVSGEIDIECGSTTRTLARQARVDFTLLTYVTGTELLVRVGSGIDGLDGLEGKTVALLPGTTTETLIRSALAKRTVSAVIKPVRDHDEGVAAVEAGTADAYASDEAILIGLARKARDPGQLRLTGALYSLELYALMIRQNDAAFRQLADGTLARIYRSGDINDVYQRWFADWTAPPSRLLVALFLLQSIPE